MIIQTPISSRMNLDCLDIVCERIPQVSRAIAIRHKDRQREDNTTLLPSESFITTEVPQLCLEGGAANSTALQGQRFVCLLDIIHLPGSIHECSDSILMSGWGK